MKVYAVTLLVVDLMRVDTQTVEWTDEHPLNSTRTMRAAFEELFPR